MDQTTTLYRPVGQRELELIAESGYRAFPPRLSHQPVFYPVLTEAYAVEIARDWNTTDAASGFAGYVTRFAIDAAYLARYPVQGAGTRRHQELWVPAADLPEFNRHIAGQIEVIAEFRGDRASYLTSCFTRPSDRHQVPCLASLGLVAAVAPIASVGGAASVRARGAGPIRQARQRRSVPDTLRGYDRVPRPTVWSARRAPSGLAILAHLVTRTDDLTNAAPDTRSADCGRCTAACIESLPVNLKR